MKNKPSDDGSSDTPQVHGMEMLTPRRVAFAAAEAFADGLLPSVKILSVFSSLRPWKSSHLRLCGAVCRKRAQSLLKSTYCPLLLPLVPLYRLVSLGGYASCNWRQQKRGLVLGVILGRISDLLAGTVRSDARSPPTAFAFAPHFYLHYTQPEDEGEHFSHMKANLRRLSTMQPKYLTRPTTIEGIAGLLS